MKHCHDKHMITWTIAHISKTAGLSICIVYATAVLIFSPGTAWVYLHPEGRMESQFSINLVGKSNGVHCRKSLFIYDRV